MDLEIENKLTRHLRGNASCVYCKDLHCNVPAPCLLYARYAFHVCYNALALCMVLDCCDFAFLPGFGHLRALGGWPVVEV